MINIDGKDYDFKKIKQISTSVTATLSISGEEGTCTTLHIDGREDLKIPDVLMILLPTRMEQVIGREIVYALNDALKAEYEAAEVKQS